jgi:pimeloyl-ACP methyl ester carboxylesterase
VQIHRLVRKDHLVLIAVISTLVIASSSISNYGYFDFTKVVYGQPNSLNMQDIPLKKVHVGDIDVAYKMFGKGEPIILLNGASDNMDAWDPSFLKGLSSNHTVIVFDSRGIANTTLGSRSYSMQQLADYTAGLLDALKIPKADVMGHSLGSMLSQAFTISHPEKVSRLILVSSSCGGKEGIPKPAEFLKMQADLINKSLNHIPLPHEELQAVIAASYGQNWLRMHPESGQIPENITSLQQAKPGLPPEVAKDQNNVADAWLATNWSGACDELAKLDKPTLVMTGADDNDYVPHGNSLKIAEKIPGAWLVQIKNASHAVINQYPEEVDKIMNTFLSTLPNN